MDKLKYIKLENEDGSYSSSIPISVEAQYIDINNEQDLADYINENNINIHNLQNATSGLNNKVDTNTSAIQGLASGSPKGSYATVEALISANPATGVYIIQADGHVYSWTKNGDTAIDLGAYQAVVNDYYGFYNNQIKMNNLSITSLNPEILDDLYLNWGETIDLENDSSVEIEDNCYYWIPTNTEVGSYGNLRKSESTDFRSYKYYPDANTTWTIDGADFWQQRCVLVVDPNQNNKVIFSTVHDQYAVETQKAVFSIDRPGLIIIMSGCKNMWDKTSGINEQVKMKYRWLSRPRLRKLLSIEKKYNKVRPKLLWTWKNCISSANHILTYNESDRYTTYVYELTKGYTYRFKGYNYGVVNLYTIVDKNMTTIYEDSWAEHTGYGFYRGKDFDYTPTEDCYLLMSRYIIDTEEHYEDKQPYRYCLEIVDNLPLNTITYNDKVNFKTIKEFKKIKEYITLNPSEIATKIIDYGYIRMSYDKNDIGEFLKTPAVMAGYGNYFIPVTPGDIYWFKVQHNYEGTAWGICDENFILKRAVDLPSSGLSTMVEDTVMIEPGEAYLVLATKNFNFLRKVISFDIKGEHVLNGLKICYDGDSLTESRLSGIAANGGAYAKLIADKVDGTYENQAVGGGTITSQKAVGGTRHSVYDNLENLPTDANIYVFSGGINDYWQSQTLGEITTGYTDEINPGTICGALEGIFRYAIDNFLGKPILFVITHKVSQTHLIPNSKGYTFQDVVDKIIAICKKYSIPYYNAFDESGVNGGISSQSLEFMTAGSSGSPDGCHINEKGYGKYYVPQIIAKLESMVNLDYLDK